MTSEIGDRVRDELARVEQRCADLRKQLDEAKGEAIRLRAALHALGEPVAPPSHGTNRDPLAIGERIKTLREVRHMSLSELSRRSEVAKSYLWRVEAGKGERPGADTLQRVAIALGVTIADLID